METAHFTQKYKYVQRAKIHVHTGCLSRNALWCSACGRGWPQMMLKQWGRTDHS